MRGLSRAICLRTDAILQQLQWSEACQLSSPWTTGSLKLSPPANQDKTPIRVNLLVLSFSLVGRIPVINDSIHSECDWVCAENLLRGNLEYSRPCVDPPNLKQETNLLYSRQFFIISTNCMELFGVVQGTVLKYFLFFQLALLCKLRIYASYYVYIYL